MTTRSLLGRALLVALGLALAASAGLGLAEGPRAPAAAPLLVLTPTPMPVAGLIPVQGRLTNAGGTPLNGSYTVTFRLYDSTGTAVCTSTLPITTTNGLFTAYMAGCSPSVIDGRQLHLGVQVQGDPEMAPRQPIYPVPYAWSLLPGANILGSQPWGSSIYAWNRDSSTRSFGVTGLSSSPLGAGVHGSSPTSGHGVEAFSFGTGGSGSALWAENGGGGIAGWVKATSTDSTLVVENLGSGPLIKAFGAGSGEDEFRVNNNGAIESKADSYVFIPGSEGQRQTGVAWATEIRGYDGSLTVGMGTGGGTTSVMFTGALPGVLYGQRVKVRNVTVFYKVILNDGTARISKTEAYRTYHDGGNSQIVNDTTQRSSTTYGYYVLPTTGENLLDVDDGFVSVVLPLHFDDNLARIQIGGIRLGLGHHELY